MRKTKNIPKWFYPFLKQVRTWDKLIKKYVQTVEVYGQFRNDILGRLDGLYGIEERLRRLEGMLPPRIVGQLKEGQRFVPLVIGPSDEEIARAKMAGECLNKWRRMGSSSVKSKQGKKKP